MGLEVVHIRTLFQILLGKGLDLLFVSVSSYLDIDEDFFGSPLFR